MKQTQISRFHTQLPGAALFAFVLACFTPARASEFTVLHSFSEGPGGSIPVSGPIFGRDGRLYGATARGGANGGGVVFAIEADGSGFEVLASFAHEVSGSTTPVPGTALLQAQDGLLYGTLMREGSFAPGILYSVAADGSELTIVREFTYLGGNNLVRDLLEGKDGTLYGTANSPSSRLVWLYALQPDDNTLTYLFNFETFLAEGVPLSGVIQGADGRLYGVTSGDSYAPGRVFAIGTDGTGFTSLAQFTRAPSGGFLMQGTDGRLYGITKSGGAFEGGTVFALESDGTGFVVLHELDQRNEGGHAHGALVQANDGKLYGTTGPLSANISDGTGRKLLHGTGGSIFALNPDGSKFEVLHFMEGAVDWPRPHTSLIIGDDGRLYGINTYGGSGRNGTVFVFEPGANEPPKIANPAEANSKLHLPLSYQIAATRAPTTFTATGLPSWLSLDSKTGLISGTPTEMGDFPITLGASNAYGFGTGDIVLTIGKATATATINNTRQMFDGAPKSVTVTTLPAGLDTIVTYDGSTSPPSAIGEYSLEVTIDDVSYEGSLSGLLRIYHPDSMPPSIGDQPTGATVAAGESVSFTVVPVGTSPFSYQWRKNDEPIHGATGDTYSIDKATTSSSGGYRVLVTNAFGSIWSGEAILTVIDPPAFVAQPTLKTAVLGGNVTFVGEVSGTGPFAYQWRRNGVDIADATDSTLTLTNVHVGQDGNYSVVVSNAVGSATSIAAALTIDTTPRLINVSCRGFAGTGDDTLVMGFYISGTGSKTLLIRGIGPKLADYVDGDVVIDPRITVYRDNKPLDGNDDWDAALGSEFTRMGAFALTGGSKDAAMTLTLEAGHGYTVHLVNDGPVAEGLIEVYDLSRDLGSRLTNVSCRLDMQAGQTVILGTALIGGPTHVLARGVGPGIATYLQNPADALADPHLRIYRGDDQVALNDDWELATRAWFVPTGAFELPDASKDAAIRVPFSPGGHTVHATGKGGGGVTIIELYESP